MAKYTIGLDYGTLSGRALIVNVETGEELASSVYEYYSAFDEFAPKLLDMNSRLILIDELGKFEASCKKLQDAVEEAFSSSANVIAVLRLDAPGWINELKLREDMLVFNVNTDNRNLLVEKLIYFSR